MVAAVETVAGVAVVVMLGGGGDGLSMDGSTDAAISAMPGRVVPRPDLSLRGGRLGGKGVLIVLPHRSMGVGPRLLNRAKNQRVFVAAAVKIAARRTSVKALRQRRLDDLFRFLGVIAHYWCISDCRLLLLRRIIQLRHTHVSAILYSLRENI